MRQVCFRLSQPDPGEATRRGHASPLTLGSTHADALAELLQVFACGEESAALAFGHLAGTQAEVTTRTALAVIADEESVHEALLRGLRDALPDPVHDPALRRTLIRFYGGLRYDDAGQHLAAIAALDSAVCGIVGALLRRGSPLRGEGRTASVFSRIHREEAGHVRLSRVLARELAGSKSADDIAVLTRERLVDVMALRGAAFDALCVDPDALFARIRRPSRSLFA